MYIELLSIESIDTQEIVGVHFTESSMMVVLSKQLSVGGSG